jgi:glycerol-3-phosphate dehydrogenase
MDDEQKDAYIKQDPAYGKIVCRCETVSEGEIRAAIRQNPPAWDLDGVKRRTRSGMGRCQGGFCGPKVLEILAREWGCDPTDINKNNAGSHMVTGLTRD